MKIIYAIVFLLSVTSVASATSYAFTLENYFAQSAIVAEVQITGSKKYVSKFLGLEEVEVECKILKLYKGPANLKSLRVKYYAKRKPENTQALVFIFRPSTGNELRAFNGASGVVGEKETQFSLSYKKLKEEVARFQKSGTARPMKGFPEGTLKGAKPLKEGSLGY
ncbi:hypothetical protein [Oceaniferula spumae]